MTGGKSKATTPSDTTYAAFFSQVLAKLGIHGNTALADQLGLADVVREEGTNAYYNPFNIESKGTPFESAWTGTHAINSVGVQAYGSFQQGVDATAAYLQSNAHWQPLLDALQSGSKSQIDHAFQEVYTWGNHFANGLNVSTNTDRNILASKMGTNSVDVKPPNAGERIVTGIDNAVSSIDSVPKLIKWLTTPDNLIRIGFIVLGLFVLLIGVDKLSGGGITGQSGGGTPMETIDVVAGNAPGNRKTIAGRAVSAPSKAVRSGVTQGERGANTAKGTATSAASRTVEHKHSGTAERVVKQAAE